MLPWFHVVLVASGILFSVGFSAYEVVAYRRGGSASNLLLALFFMVGGLGLGIYLRGFIRRSL